MGAARGADYLEAEAAPLRLHRPGLRIVELGAGVGWLSLVLAANLPAAARVLATEQAAGHAWLQANVARNAHLPLTALRTCVCDWSAFASSGSGHARDGGSSGSSSSGGGSDADAAADAAAAELQGPWDVVLGSDLVYNEAGVRQLPRALAALAHPETTVLYAHTKRRFEHMDGDFFAALADAGLVWREVREAWAPPPPPSPPAFESLFPDMRLAVFRISLAAVPVVV